MALTDITIRKKAKQTDKPYKLFDGHGLYLLVKPNGRKYWRLQYRHSGKQKTLALGVYPEVTLKTAREKQADARKLINENIDPMENKREVKRADSTRIENTFAAIAKEWHDQQKGRWSADHATRVIESLEKEAFPYIGNKGVEDLTAPYSPGSGKAH